MNLQLLMDMSKWSVDNILALVSIVLAIIGGIFAFKQWRNSIKIKRAEFIDQIIKNLRFDKELVNAMNIIDYNPKWYDKNFHNQKNGIEKDIDKLLAYLAYICYLRSEKLILKKEFTVLEYEINRACLSPSTQRYLWNLFHFSAANKAKCSFQYLIDYAIQNKFIDKGEFMNPMSVVYSDCKMLHF